MRALFAILLIIPAITLAAPRLVLPGGGGGTPGGSNTQVQFNDSSAFGGDAGLIYDKATDKLTIGSALTVNGAAAHFTGLGPVWPFIPTGSAAGVMEIGQYLDFHQSSADGLDYGARLFLGLSGLETSASIQSSQFKGPVSGTLECTALSGTNCIGNVTNGAMFDLGTGGNDYLTSNGSTISTPGSITATGGFVGNASTATALNSTGTTSQFWRGDNTWAVTAPIGASYVTTSADANLTAEVVLPTCSAGTVLTFNGTTISCVTDQTSAGGSYGTVQDESSNLTQRSTINFLGGGVSCADNSGTGTTDCTIPTPTASAGGSTTQVQYNNATALGGMARVTTDGNDLVLTGVIVHPTAPAAGSLKVYGFQHRGANGPPIPQFVDGNLGFDHHVQPYTRGDDAVWGCVLPGASGNATLIPTGRHMLGSATGTAGTVAWASTDERTRWPWVNFPQASNAVNLNAGYRANVDYVWRGNAAGIGGFYWWGTFAINTTDTTSRLFVGLKDATAVLTATADPSAALDTVYFGIDNAQTTLRVCSNDNSGAATCTDLGANYPATTTNVAYDVAFWAAPNGSTINYWIRKFDSAISTSGTISTDLPRATVQLGWDFTRNTGGTADAVAAMRFGGTCYIGNP